jgi:hypothetical protein
LSNTKPTTLDRLLAAYPLVVAYLILLFLYAWQTTRVPAPWIFTDELQWSMLSRAIAHTGHAQLRLRDVANPSLYSYMLAPAWWLGASMPGYSAAKYLNAVVMTASLFPAYGLSRFFLPRPAALLAAVGAAAIPSLALTGVLMPESLAYFWSTLALYLVARLLLRPGAVSLVLALAAIALAPEMRGQLAVLAPAAGIALAVMLLTTERGRATLRSWTPKERVGAVVLLVGAVIAVDVMLAHHSHEWFIGTHFWHRAFTYGLWALGAFTIGVGVVPSLFALAWVLGLPIETREDRALLGLLLGTLIGFGVYTAVKASYISTTFSVRVEERNLIYLSPVVLVASLRFVLAARTRIVPLAASAGAIGYLIWTTPYHAYEHLYSDAFGLAILQWLNQEFSFTNTDLRRLLFGILAAGTVFALARTFVRQRSQLRLAIVAAATAGLLGIAWNLAGEIQAANASIPAGKSQRAQLPNPPDWVDRETGRARTMFIGQSLSNSYAFWSLEFWNQSIQDVWSVDASAPPPGESTTPNFQSTDGTVEPQIPVHWVLAQPAMLMGGRIAERAGGLDLYRVKPPIRMVSFTLGVTPDGWMQEQTSFIRFARKPLRGTIAVSLSRTAACGDVPASHFTFRISDLRINKDKQPIPGPVQRVEHRTIRSTPCEQGTFHFPATAPFRLDATASPTFLAGDGRQLSAQISYAFTPSP